MAELLWKKGGGAFRAAEALPFKSEDEFESLVVDFPSILGDVFLLKQQVQGGGKRTRPDILGLDLEGRICVIELKNVDVDPTVIPQVLNYAIWADTHPDSIRALWHEAKNRPKDLKPDWNNLEVRILIAAPHFEPETIDVAAKIGYSVDLVEVSRWKKGPNVWLAVEHIEPEEHPRTKPVSGRGTYDRNAYEEDHSPESVDGFLRLSDEIVALAKKQKWPVERKFNKYYCGFKIGSFVVFGIKWLGGKKAYGLYFQVGESVMTSTKVAGFPKPRYEHRWKRAVYRIDGKSYRLSAFMPLFRKAIEKRSP